MYQCTNVFADDSKGDGDGCVYIYVYIFPFIYLFIYPSTIPFAEILYGMGEHRHTGTPANGTGSVRIPKPWNQWMQDSQNYGKSFGGDNTIPILHSTVGYSFLWNSPAFGGIELTDDLHSWNSTLTTMLDFWVSTTPASIANDESKLAPLLTVRL